MSAYSRMNLKNEHNNSFNRNKFRLRYEGATLYECIPSTIHLLMEKNEEKSKLKWKINELKNKEFIFALVRFLSPRFDIWRLRSSGQFFSLWLNLLRFCLFAGLRVCVFTPLWPGPKPKPIKLYYNPPKSPIIPQDYEDMCQKTGMANDSICLSL